ncbi:MAG: c-type cytochrome [Hyphomicrobiaceae bacterium]
MVFFPRSRLGRIVGAMLGALAGLGVVLVFLAWTGVYNVAASRGHWSIVEWFLAFGMRNSVATRALAITAPPLDDPDLVQLGAGHFQSGCAFCHAAPGMPHSPIALHMLPPPPELSKAAKEWKDGELFWIVKHGIKYTGMPSWVAAERDDEVWSVVAFLKRLNSLDAAGYRDLLFGGLQSAPQSGAELATTGPNSDQTGACARCHGAEGRAPRSRLVPILHGQPVEFLTTALKAYAAGKRQSGIMQPVAANLSPSVMQALAAHYAGLPAPPPATTAEDAAAVARGRRLADEGIAASGVPPCMACHGSDALAAYPRLAGQHAEYMIGQLRLWQRGIASGTDGAATMAPIARRLTERQIIDASVYFASLRSQQAGAGRRP